MRVKQLLFGAALAAMLAPVPAGAFTILAKLDRDGNGAAGPSDRACTFRVNQSTQVSTQFNGGFTVSNPIVDPVVLPPNSQIIGKASADLATGLMRGEAFAASYGINELHSMRFVSLIEEFIEFDFPIGLLPSQRVVKLIGEVHATGTATGVGSGKALYSLEVDAIRAAAALDNDDGWDVLDGENDSAIAIDTLANGFRFTITIVNPSSGDIFLATQLEGTATARGTLAQGPAIANADASNTASLTMILPAGTTYESTSGVFLTQVPTAAPEPLTWTLTLAGIGVLAATRRRNRRH